MITQSLYSQRKSIKGDTVYWFKRNLELQKTLNLNNLEKSDDDFNFRFWNQGQVIEISKDSLLVNATITNYIYHTRRSNPNKSEILSDKTTLSKEQAEIIFNIVQKSDILNLPTDKDIEDWKHGVDGIVYIVEHSDKKNYWIKNYWTPTSQDSIPEALIVQNLVRKLSDTLNLQRTYKSFQDTLPKKGCYNSGGLGNMCYIANSLEIGYSGASKLPLGFFSSYSGTYLGNHKVNGSLVFQYNFDNSGFYHLNMQASKWYIFYKKSPFTDYVAYNYQQRKLKINNDVKEFRNHQIKYGLNLKKNFGIGGGVDLLTGNHQKVGGNLYVNKLFSEPNISTVLSTSVFNNQINYKAQVFKSFKGISKLAINRFTLGLTYESFMKYDDLYFNVLLSL